MSRCPDYARPSVATRAYMEMDLESPYGVPGERPMPISFYNTPIPIQQIGGALLTNEASSRYKAPRIKPVDLAYTFDGTIALYGGSTIGQPPNWMSLLEICGFRRDDRAGIPTYVPVNRCKSATITTWLDGPKHVSSGVRGLVSLTGSAGALSEVQFGLTGLWADPSTESIPTSPVDPVVTSRVCGVNFRIDVDGYGTIIPVFKSYLINLGGSVALRGTANKTGNATEVYHLGGRQPTWQVTIEINDDHQWSKWFQEQRRCTLSMSLPTVNRRSINLTTPVHEATVEAIPQYAIDNGIRCWQIIFSLQTADFITITHQ